MEIQWHSKGSGTKTEEANGSTNIQLPVYDNRKDNRTLYKVSKTNKQASCLSSTQEVEGLSPVRPHMNL